MDKYFEIGKRRRIKEAAEREEELRRRGYSEETAARIAEQEVACKRCGGYPTCVCK